MDQDKDIVWMEMILIDAAGLDQARCIRCETICHMQNIAINIWVSVLCE